MKGCVLNEMLNELRGNNVSGELSKMMKVKVKLWEKGELERGTVFCFCSYFTFTFHRIRKTKTVS